MTATTYDPRGLVRALVRARLTDEQLEALGRAAVARVTAMKNAAAPGESGTAAPADTPRERSAMDYAMQQAKAARALVHMLLVGVPAASWHITQDGRLCGYPDGGTDEEVRQVMRRFAEFLGGRLVSERGSNGHAEWVDLSVSAMYRGASVTVWAHTYTAPDFNEELQS